MRYYLFYGKMREGRGYKDLERWDTRTWREGRGYNDLERGEGIQDSKTILPKEHHPSLRLITPGEIFSDSVSKFGILV